MHGKRNMDESEIKSPVRNFYLVQLKQSNSRFEAEVSRNATTVLTTVTIIMVKNQNNDIISMQFTKLITVLVSNFHHKACKHRSK